MSFESPTQTPADSRFSEPTNAPASGQPEAAPQQDTPMPESPPDQSQGQGGTPTSGSCLGSLLVWMLLIGVAYFASDIVDKGQVLNSLTPYPVLGYALWALIAGVVWYFLIDPVIQFVRLKHARVFQPDKAASRALRKLQRHKNQMHTPQGELYWKLYDAYEDRRSVQEERRARLIALLREYREICGVGKQARTLILNYCRAASLGVVFSRNGMIDGLILLLLQMRLVVNLAKLYGYRISPVFNTLCLAWVASNSVAMAFLGQATAEQAGELVSKEFAGIVGELFLGSDEAMMLTANALGTVVIKEAVQALLEAIMGATAVYVTGRVFLHLLERDGDRITVEALIAMRREGRRTIGKEMLVGMPSELGKSGMKKLAALFSKTSS